MLVKQSQDHLQASDRPDGLRCWRLDPAPGVLEGRNERALCAVELAEGESCDLDIRLRGVLEDGYRWIVLRRMRRVADIQRLDVMLSLAEADLGRARGTTRIVACPTDTAEAALLARDFRGVSRRLDALLWDEIALRSDLGLPATDDGAMPDPIREARGLFLLSTAAARLCAIDGDAGHQPQARFAGACLAARQIGFGGILAYEDWQIPVIKAAFAGDQTVGRLSSKTSVPPSA